MLKIPSNENKDHNYPNACYDIACNFSRKTTCMHGKLSVSLRKQDGMIHFSVMDNGLGVEPAALQGIGDSFGYKMIHAFKDKLDVELTFTNVEGLKVDMIF